MWINRYVNVIVKKIQVNLCIVANKKLRIGNDMQNFRLTRRYEGSDVQKRRTDIEKRL